MTTTKVGEEEPTSSQVKTTVEEVVVLKFTVKTLCECKYRGLTTRCKKLVTPFLTTIYGPENTSISRTSSGIRFRTMI